MIFLDNFSSQKTDEEVRFTEKSSTEIRKFPPEATELLQAAESFLIQNIKYTWIRLLDNHILETVKKGLFNDRNNPNGSG